MLAKLGGFLGRNCDGEPGSVVIARGLAKFHFALSIFPLFVKLEAKFVGQE